MTLNYLVYLILSEKPNKKEFEGYDENYYDNLVFINLKLYEKIKYDLIERDCLKIYSDYYFVIQNSKTLLKCKTYSFNENYFELNEIGEINDYIDTNEIMGIDPQIIEVRTAREIISLYIDNKSDFKIGNDIEDFFEINKVSNEKEAAIKELEVINTYCYYLYIDKDNIAILKNCKDKYTNNTKTYNKLDYETYLKIDKIIKD